jgi:hypothetical protein
MWNNIVELILPQLKGFTLWQVNPRLEYAIIEFENFCVIDEETIYLAVSCAKERELPPFKTEGPIMELLEVLSDKLDVDVFRQMNRSGPFYGNYIRIGNS